ncbi:MAG TPA: histidine phosphotransferase family protein [Patescibacteria group bacterium]|nr:histidine phosphotransferase family protein [Patescibacteria group bacterium]
MDVLLSPRVMELIASRICHDLVSPVGAVSNGVELLQELGEDAGEEAMKLIADSALQASIRLKAFRLSYGAAGTDKNVGFKDIRDVFTDLLTSGRVQAEFEPDLAVKFSMPPRGFFKVLLNLLILAEECNHGEGKIAVSAIEGNKGIRILVTGKNPGFREGAEAALRGETAADDLDPRSVHAYVTGRFAAAFDLKISWAGQADLGRVEFQLFNQ